MVTTYLKLFRAAGDELDNAIISDITFRLLSMETAFNSLSGTPDSQDLIQVLQPQSHDFLEIFDCCFHAGYTKKEQDYFLVNEPDYDHCKLLLEFDYRSESILDQSGFENHAFLVGRPRMKLFQNEAPNYSMHFNGTDSLVSLAHTTDFDFSAFGFSVWFYPESASDKRIIIDRGANPSLVNGSFQLYLDTSNNLVFESKNNAGSSFSLSCNTPVTQGFAKWYNAIIRFNGSLLQIRIYYNTTDFEDFSVAMSGTFNLDAPLTYGSTSSSFQGDIDEPIIYKRNLDDEEVEYLHSMDEELQIPIKDMISWHGFNDKYFAENFHIGLTKDLSNYNTGTISNATFSTNVPSNFTEPFQYKDFVGNFLLGYKFIDEELPRQYLHIPEKNNDLRLEGRATDLTYCFQVLIKDSSKQNEWQQRIIEKYDSEDGNFGYTIQISEDRKLHVYLRYNGSQKEVETIAQLPENILTHCLVQFDIEEIINDNISTNCVRLGIEGFFVDCQGVEPDAEPNFPDDDNPVPDFNIRIGKAHTERGYIHDNMLFNLRAYDRQLTDLELLSLVTNKHTIFELPLGTVAHLNLTPLVEESPWFRTFRDDITIDKTVMERFEGFLQDVIPTGRFSETLTQDLDEMEVLKGLIPGGGGYSLEFNGTTTYARSRVYAPIEKTFSVFAWIKYTGNIGGWGTIVTAVDGLGGGNAFFVNATQLRWLGSFDHRSDPWKDFRCTIPSITGSWHLVGVTYNGGDPDRLRFWLDTKIIKQVHVHSPMISGDSNYSYLGSSGVNKLVFGGKMDKLGLWYSELTQAHVNDLFLKNKGPSTNRIAFYDFSQNGEDESVNNLDLTIFNGSFSTDTP